MGILIFIKSLLLRNNNSIYIICLFISTLIVSVFIVRGCHKFRTAKDAKQFAEKQIEIKQKDEKKIKEKAEVFNQRRKEEKAIVEDVESVPKKEDKELNDEELKDLRQKTLKEFKDSFPAL